MPKRSQPRQTSSNDSPQRVQKLLAAAGFGSRRKCEEFVLAGRVTVDGKEIRELSTRADPSSQKICVDGEPLRLERKLYFVLNKPAGYLCTSRDPSGRSRVIDLFTRESARLFTVGRLDENSEGLILVTNDGDLGNRLAHPRYGIVKTYHVQVAGNPNPETLLELKKGIYFSHGKFRVHGVKRIRKRGKSTFLEIELSEGQNREIRRLLARVGHKVIHLQRVGFGPLKLGRLPLGKYRALRPAELNTLRECVSKNRPDTSKKRRGSSTSSNTRQHAKSRRKTGSQTGRR